MNEVIVSLKSSTIAVAFISGLLAIIGVLASMIWQNFRSKLSAVEKMSQLISKKLDLTVEKNSRIIEDLKIEQTRHELQIVELNNHQLRIERQLTVIRKSLLQLPAKILKLQKKN